MTGSTKFGYPSYAFDTRLPNPRLGSGIVFNDESAGRKELAANSHRIEGWRKTNSYEYICAVSFFLVLLGNIPILKPKKITGL